jgi:hypothetical protein
MKPSLIELDYPDFRPRGKYCAKRHFCSCGLPADYRARLKAQDPNDDITTYFCIQHVGEWAAKHGIEIPVRKVAA